MGFKPLTLLSVSNTFYAVDNETGILYWQKQTPPSASPSCEAGPAASLSRANSASTTITAITVAGPRARGAYISGVGKPGEGIPPELMAGGMFGPVVVLADRAAQEDPVAREVLQQRADVDRADRSVAALAAD